MKSSYVHIYCSMLTFCCYITFLLFCSLCSIDEYLPIFCIALVRGYNLCHWQFSSFSLSFYSLNSSEVTSLEIESTLPSVSILHHSFHFTQWLNNRYNLHLSLSLSHFIKWGCFEFIYYHILYYSKKSFFFKCCLFGWFNLGFINAGRRVAFGAEIIQC